MVRFQGGFGFRVVGRLQYDSILRVSMIVVVYYRHECRAASGLSSLCGCCYSQARGSKVLTAQDLYEGWCWLRRDLCAV